MKRDSKRNCCKRNHPSWFTPLMLEMVWKYEKKKANKTGTTSSSHTKRKVSPENEESSEEVGCWEEVNDDGSQEDNVSDADGIGGIDVPVLSMGMVSSGDYRNLQEKNRRLLLRLASVERELESLRTSYSQINTKKRKDPPQNNSTTQAKEHQINREQNMLLLLSKSLDATQRCVKELEEEVETKNRLLAQEKKNHQKTKQKIGGR